MFTSSPSGEESISPMITTSDTNDEAQDDNGNLIIFQFAITLKNVDNI